MGLSHFHLGESGTALTTADAPTPNNAGVPASEDKTFLAPSKAGGPVDGYTAFAVSAGGTTCSVKLWVWNEVTGRWAALAAAGTACAADLVVALQKVPQGAKCYVELTAVTGSEQLDVGFYEG